MNLTPFVFDIDENIKSEIEKLNIPAFRKSESYKYTNISSIFDYNYKQGIVSENIFLHQIVDNLNTNYTNLIFVNGIYVDIFSNINSCSFDVKTVSRDIQWNVSADDFFYQLNNLIEQKEVTINIKGPNPYLINIINISVPEANPHISIPRISINLEKNSYAKIMETYLYLDITKYFNNIVTNIKLNEGSKLDYYKIICENDESYHINSTIVDVGKDATFNSFNFSTSGAITRNNLTVNLANEGANADLKGFYAAKNKSVIDNNLTVNHLKPHTTSKQLYKGVMNHESIGVFNGLVTIHQNAQQSNSNQLNKNLLLSKTATINTRPQLKIFADDVKATHGATSGQLSKDEIFYLQSRGISKEKAVEVLTKAFIDDILNKVDDQMVRNNINHLLNIHFWVK